MRTILLSLTTVFAVSITGCLDEAPQPQQRSGVVTAEPYSQDPSLRDDIREQPTEQYESDVTPNDGDDGGDDGYAIVCETSVQCPHHQTCNLQLHRCGVIE